MRSTLRPFDMLRINLAQGDNHRRQFSTLSEKERKKFLNHNYAEVARFLKSTGTSLLTPASCMVTP